MLKQIIWFAMVFALVLSMEVADDFGVELNNTQKDNLKGIKYQCSYLEKNRIFSYKLVQEKIEKNQFIAPVLADKTVNLYFSFCDDTELTCENVIKEDLRGSAIIKDSITNHCTRISGNKWDDATVSLISSPSGWKKDYLQLTWTGIDDCDYAASKGQKWKFSVDVVCTDQDWGIYSFVYTGGNDATCHIKSEFQSKIGCAIVSFNAIWEFFAENKVIFGIVLIGVGLFLNIAGYRIFIVTLFLTGVIVTVSGIMILSYLAFVKEDAKAFVGWILLACSVILGIFVGWVLAKYRRFGVFFICCIGGACLGLLLNNAVMRYAESQVLFWLIIVGCGLLLGVISCFLYVQAAILSTAFVGAYMAIRGVSIFLGHFPNEMTLIEQIKEGILPKTEWQVWVYLIFIVILFVGGSYLQWRCRPEKSGKDKANSEYYRV